VELPVTGKADALFFLQTSAWTSKVQHGSYIVHYADGTRYEIQLTGETNLRDWAANTPDAPFSQETDTITRVAWTGKTPSLPAISLYLMAWPNPHPEKEIRGVTFTSTNVGVPVLVGLTAGVKPEGGLAIASTAGDPAAAAKLVTEGRALRQAGKLDDAAARFEAARKTDAHNEAAYLELAGVRENQKRWTDAIAAYNALLAVAPENLEALIRLGKAYEEVGDWDSADKIYRHSLDVNRNQPEILKAIADLKVRRK
jgi:tetratricopeptide (TPR) repeat protein